MVETFNDYQNQIRRTGDFLADNKSAMLHYAVFGLSSEAGEVASIMQKQYQGHEFDLEHFKKELGDCLWFITEACNALGLSLADVATTNINKLKCRYPDGFKPENSLHRDVNDV